MKKVLITGGLGNQMFQYAFACALRAKGIGVKLDISYYDYWSKFNWHMHNGYELEHVFGIKENYINKQGLHMKWIRLLDHYDPLAIIKKDENQFDCNYTKTLSRYYFGYWQDEKYFIDIKEEIHNIFQFQNIDQENNLLAQKMLSCNSVSLHIRRGDYSKLGMTIIGEDYYAKAIKHIITTVANPFFFIFSDDKDEARNIAKQMNISYTIIDNNHGSNSYKDMYLMSKCKHNIIANSSFSWWGAWLNNNENKIVIAPETWDVKLTNFHPQPTNWLLF